MTMGVKSFPEKYFDQSSISSMSHLSVNWPSWWNTYEQQITQALSKNLSWKQESPSHLCQEANHLCLRQQDQDSSATLSNSLSHHKMTTAGGPNSKDQCVPSESVQNGTCGKEVDEEMKPVFFVGHPDLVTNPSQMNFSRPINQSYPSADPYYGCLFTAHGPEAMILPQMAGMASARVLLHHTEDGPIYVNAKQYHGILRRRQTRAKLGAHNKRAKSRRPYLHESRHVHALKRLRGSGGRFLSTKKLQQPDPNPTTGFVCISGPIHSYEKGDNTSKFGVHHQSETDQSGGSITSFSSITSVTNSDVIFQQPDCKIPAITPHMSVTVQGSGRLMCNGN